MLITTRYVEHNNAELYNDNEKKDDQLHLLAEVADTRSKEHVDKKLHKVVNKREKTYECHLCKKLFVSKGNLNQHFVVHTGEKSHVCHVCQKAYKRKSSLVNHLTTHTEEIKFCPICKKKFVIECDLEAHKLIHMGQKPYKCDICENTYSRKGYFEKHIKMHKKQQMTCKVCYKEFSTDSALANHSLEHTEERPYKCEICDAAFFYYESLKDHLLIHSGQKLYVCHICFKQFCQRKACENHLLVHNNKGRYICEICQSAFTRKKTLKKHLYSHIADHTYAVRSAGL